MEVEGGLARPWTLDDLARRAHVSREQLRCLCRRQFGRSPMEHLAHLRMHRAVILITRTTGKIHKIARDVGYQDPYTFSTAFHRHFGVTPSSLRKARH